MERGPKEAMLITGFQPTGPLHIGNYLGALKHSLELQEEYAGKFNVFVADYHALSGVKESVTKAKNSNTKNASEVKSHLSENISILCAELLAVGFDPKKVTLYIQSDVPEVTELSWIFNTVTPVSFLERMTQYKDKVANNDKNANVGLFAYPILQAADILLPKASLVPVGQDQIQHVELTRDIVRFFNNKFGEFFVEPHAKLGATAKVMSLKDPEKKMSKSDPDSYISLMDSPQVIHQKMRGAVTDTGPVKDRNTMSAGVRNLFDLLTAFGTPEDVGAMDRAYRDGSIKYAELKDLLATRIADHFAEFRKKREAFLKDPKKVRAVFAAGAKKVRPIARKTMEEVRKKVGIG